MKENCINCGQPIANQASTGRPPDYCSVACRRMAEREVLRLEKRIATLEEDIMQLRICPPETRLAHGRCCEVILRTETELANQIARFKHLLSATKSENKKRHFEDYKDDAAGEAEAPEW